MRLDAVDEADEGANVNECGRAGDVEAAPFEVADPLLAGDVQNSILDNIYINRLSFF